MGSDEISIGRFGRLCGLSVHTLRHDDDVGLLVPARVDVATGYRYHLPEQLDRARHVRSLRWTDLSVEDTRTVLDDPARADAVRLRLRGHAAHRRALDAGATELLGPHDTAGMPRSSAVRDPDANVVWLYQG